ncbi:MAG: hypothetical protein CMD15_04270 [Flavobacteriales bacterium]|nr:hypothetical protein [Flavobacteriales bacterium]|tara:strand:- start:155632 stop:157266 length:1635 start_codon:yes stop_codon:yes gene_type:complete
MRYLYFTLFIFSSFFINAQHLNLYLNENNDINKYVYSDKFNFHTSFKPVLKSSISFSTDSLLLSNYPIKHKNKYLKNVFSDNLFTLRGDDYYVTVSPTISFTLGVETIEKKNTFNNTRGYLVEGVLGEKISFSTSFSENQSVFPNYLDTFIRKNNVVPGQGYARIFKNTGFDYAMSSGYVSYKPNKMFLLQFGHGKHFIGDGYRSLLLSDNSFNYPFLKIQTNFSKIQYTNLYCELMDINYFKTHSIDNIDQMGYPKKYLSSHYLSYNFTTKFNISLFESVVWRMNHAPGVKGFDINYLNPIAMLRPIEFSLNSPDNVLIGLNSKYILKKSYLYGQLIVDEFSLNDLRKDNGFWGNKIGYQLGYKMFDALSIKRLSLQAEYNYVRPYTYAHHNPQQNYAHYNQPLAHPLGANFSELLFLFNYKYRRLEVSGKIIFSKHGGKVLNDPTSYGNDLYFSTGNYAEQEGLVSMGTGRPSDFGIQIYQGNLTKIEYKSLNISYIINPLTNLKLNFGLILRNQNNENGSLNTRFFNFGLISDIFNYYYDI